MNKEESIGDSVVENENVAINQDEIDTSESSVENQVNVSSDIEEAQQGANDDLRTNEEQKIHEDLVYDHEDDLQQETLETIEDTVEIEPEEQEYEDDQHVSIDQEVFTAQEEVENDQDQYADQQEVVEQADDYEEQQQEVEEIGDQKGVYIEAQQEDADSDEHINIIEDKDEAQEEIVNEANNKRSDVADDKINESEEEDFDNVVEVDEDKAESDNEDENVAQHVSDSENEDEPKTEDIKLGDVSDDDLRGASSGSENEASEDDNISVPKKKNAIASSDDEEEPNQESKEGTHHQEAVLKMFDSDSEEEQKDEGVGDLIADIFGESDDEEEFTGFGQEEISKKDEKKSSPISESEDERSERESEDEGDTVSQETPAKPVSKEGSDSDGDGGDRGLSDFDLMMKKKKEENGRHRRRRDGGTYISDADDIINAMLTKMKEAAEGDRDANLKRQPALKKLKLLKSVVVHLRKQDLKESFVDNGVIAAIADWLSLLPDRSLPHITIRTELLQILHDLPTVSAETLKHSGIGKAVMILFKHPREIRKNRESAGRLINKWSRPIFGLNENFKSMTREEREQRDLDQMPQAKRRRLSSGAQAQTEEGREGELGLLRPGEQGFVMRARVPMPSTKDYVVRPKWNVEGTMFGEEEGEWPKKSTSSTGAPRSSKKDERLEKHMRNFAERRKNSKMQRAVNISIEGNKMNI